MTSNESLRLVQRARGPLIHKRSLIYRRITRRRCSSTSFSWFVLIYVDKPPYHRRFEKAVRLKNEQYHRYAIGEAPVRRMHWQSQFFSVGTTTVTFLMLGRVTKAYFVAEDGSPPDRSFVRFKLLRDSDGVIARRLLQEYARPTFSKQFSLLHMRFC